MPQITITIKENENDGEVKVKRARKYNTTLCRLYVNSENDRLLFRKPILKSDSLTELCEYASKRAVKQYIEDFADGYPTPTFYNKTNNIAHYDDKDYILLCSSPLREDYTIVCYWAIEVEGK